MKRVACLLLGSRSSRRRQRVTQPPRTVPTFSKDVAPIVFNNCATLPSRRRSRADDAHLVRGRAAVGEGDQEQGASSREMPPWGADPAHSLKMRNDRSLTQAQIDTIVAWVDGGAPKGSDADLPPMPKFAEGWTFGREPDDDPRDAGRLRDSRGRRARRADVLLEGAVERGSLRRDARDSSGQPRRRAPRRRVRRRHSRGREDRQRPPGDAGRQGVDRSRRRRRRARRRHRAAGREQAAVVGAGPRRRFAPRRHRQADSRRQVHQLADPLQPDRQARERSHAPRHLVQQGAGDARAADPPGGRSRWRRPRAACRSIAPRARKSSTPRTKAARGAAARRRTSRPTPRTGR